MNGELAHSSSAPAITLEAFMDHQGWEITAAQLKTIQEVITLVVYCVFSVWYLREPLKWNYLVGFGLMTDAVFVIFKEW